MKSRMFSLVIAAALLLAAFTAPARADSTPVDYTGTVAFVSWVDPVPPAITPGGTVHEQIVTEWLYDTTDSRLSGTYVVAGACTWPHDKPWPWGPCHLTWTVDVNGDQQPEWEGVLVVTPQDYRIFWNGSGHGLGEYAGLHVSFKVYGGPFPPATVVGQVTGG